MSETNKKLSIEELQYLTRFAADDTSHVRIKDINICLTICEDKACTFVCPTNALYWQDDNEFSSLYFDSALCIGCEKCTLCGANAIKIHTKNCAGGEQVSEPIQLISFMLNHCQTCGDYFRSNERTELCPICDKQQNRESYFTDL